jgi:hypothetical protein
MVHAYTPGLQITPKTTMRKHRMLPLPGEVLVKVGDRVEADAVIARTELPGDVVSVNVVNQLGISPQEIGDYMLKEEGETVGENEPLAESRSLFGWFKTTIRSPIQGTVESVSKVTGQVLLRKPPQPIELTAYIDGEVIEISEGSGATIESSAAFVQGIFGIGGERVGELFLLVERPDEVITASMISEDHRRKTLIGGSLVEGEALKRAEEVGVSGIVVGGFHAADLRDWLGYDVGVALTGDEDVSTTLILTEGFGKMPMARRTFDLLSSHAGKRASISGRTQIRAGVMRPEVIVPIVGEEPASSPATLAGLEVGREVRLIREPYFGLPGRVRALPSGLGLIESEAQVRLMEVELDSGEVVTVPRANVESIEQ